jgi:hypothetical protein
MIIFSGIFLREYAFACAVSSRRKSPSREIRELADGFWMGLGRLGEAIKLVDGHDADPAMHHLWGGHHG